MPAPQPCPFRYVFKGRTFCSIAIRERRYTTTEVIPSACDSCKATKILRDVKCRYLDLGVEVDQYGGSHEVSIFYASCEKLVERITDFSNCGEGKCPYWEPLDQDRIETLKQDAFEAQRERERREGE